MKNVAIHRPSGGVALKVRQTGAVLVLMLGLVAMPGTSVADQVRVPTVQGSVDDPTVRHFQLTRHDGVPAVGAVVHARVVRRGDEPRQSRPHRFTADAAGVVRLKIPADDPVIAANPDQRLFNVVAVVIGAGPGTRTRPRVVPFVLNLGDPLWPADPTGVDGTRVALDPPLGPRVADDNPWNCHYPGYPYGTPWPAWECSDTKRPESLRSIPVPVAENFGAGADFSIAFSYRHSRNTLTSTLAGTDGFFVEAKKSATLGYEEITNGTVSLAGVRGGHAQQRLRMATGFKQISTVTCDARLGCSEYLVVTPELPLGFYSLVEGPVGSAHDRMGGTEYGDCGNYMQPGSDWTNSRGQSREMSYTLGFDLQTEVGVKFVSFTMHANTTYSKWDNTSDVAAYSWAVKESGLGFKHHYVFVPRGLEKFDHNELGGGPMACPINNPGETYTDASGNGARTVDAPEYVVDNPPEETEEAYRRVHPCIANPERCGD